MSNISDKVIKARKPKTKYPLIKEISERFSPRCFSTAEIPLEDIQKILEAARWTPSARNNQPWFFYWTQKGTKTFEQIYGALGDNNKWAKTAPILIVCAYFAKNQFGENEYAAYDLGASVLSLVLQAKSLGYYARQMGIFDREKVSKIIKTSEGQKPFIIIALGKIGDYSTAPDDLIQKDLTPSLRKEEISKEI